MTIVGRHCAVLLSYKSFTLQIILVVAGQNNYLKSINSTNRGIPRNSLQHHMQRSMNT